MKHSPRWFINAAFLLTTVGVIAIPYLSQGNGRDVPSPPVRGLPSLPPPGPPPPLPDHVRNSPPPKLPENLPSPQELREQLELLERFLQLPPEQLRRIRETIQRIEAMSPEQKESLLRRLQEMNPAVQALNLRFQEILKSAQPDNRDPRQKEWLALSFEGKQKVIEKLEALAPRLIPQTLSQPLHTLNREPHSSPLPMPSPATPPIPSTPGN